jgi:WD40 repeat protein
MNKTILAFGLLILILITFSQDSFAKTPLDSPCIMDSECESRLCNVVTEKCINKGPINSTCGLDSECESNMCNTITLKCTNAEQEARGNEVQWFMDLVKKNNGKAFCVPKGAKLREGVEALTKFSKAHPEIHDQLTDKQAIQALAESYPCTAQATAELMRTEQSTPGLQNTVHEERQIIRPIYEKSVDNSAVDWSPDGKWIATAGDPMQVTIWDAVSLSIRHQLNQGSRDWNGHSINFSPDSQFLASGFGTVNVWNVAAGTLQTTLNAPYITPQKPQYRGIESLRFSPDGRMLVVVYTGDKRIVIAYRIADGKVAWTYEPPLTIEPQRIKGSPLLTTPLVFTPDGKRVIFCTGEWGGPDVNLKWLSRILLLDAESGKFLRSIDDIHMHHPTALAISRDGKWVATGTSTGDRYWHTDKKTHQVVTFDNNDPVRIWNIETGNLVKELPVHSRVWSLVFSQDGKYLFGATRDINVWDVESGKMVQEIKSNPEPMSLALSPDGKRLAVSCQNKLSTYKIMNFQ